MKILSAVPEKMISVTYEVVFGLFDAVFKSKRRTESLVVVFQTTFSCIWFCLLLLSEENTAILNMYLEICDLENNNWPLVSSQS